MTDWCTFIIPSPVIQELFWLASILYHIPAGERAGSVNLIGEIGTHEALQGGGGGRVTLIAL